jgi:hypothetical protein
MIISSLDELSQFTDIIIDISAFPQSIYLCMINMMLNRCSHDKSIYIVVSENYTIDRITEPVEIDEFAHEMQGFSSPSEDIDSVIVWYPVLGETNSVIIKRHYDYLISSSKKIDEICPVVPFPASNVRRADDILKGYRKELFGTWLIDKRNIIYASEANPLRVRESLYNASTHYRKVLSPLGECKFVFSAITSKLMSIGVFLAVYDLKTAGINVSLLSLNNKGYRIGQKEQDVSESRLAFLLLSGNKA